MKRAFTAVQRSGISLSWTLFAFVAAWAISSGAHADIIIGGLNTPVGEDFQAYTGTGIGSNAGDLDSSSWRTTGMSDGDTAFGSENIGGDHGRGTSTGGVTTGGFYAFDTGAGNVILGIQPGGVDWNPGTVVLRLLNSTGFTITRLDVSYDVWEYNDQARSSSLSFAHSSDDSSYTGVGALDYTTAAAADPSPSWASTLRQTSITGLSIANGANYYLQWSGIDFSGTGSRDEYGLDDISVSAIPEPGTAALVGLGLIGLTAAGRRRR